jgi:SAM-dependent methyltransferase/glycosyltransferase involved in cell wall biosynthesis
MYEHFPEDMRAYYDRIFKWMKALPNVEFVGGKPNAELRQMIADSEAYIYPTQFEETSCILARECIEQQTPFITTAVGALPETLGDSGIYFEEWLFANGIQEPERGSDGWCKLFAQFFRDTLHSEPVLEQARGEMGCRNDLYWDGVAAMAEPHLFPKKATNFSRIWSLLRDGDAVPAIAFRDALGENASAEVKLLDDELCFYRRMATMDLGAYYDELYLNKVGKENCELFYSPELYGSRMQSIRDELKSLPPGAKVFEYGCGPGHVIAPLAEAYPHLAFVGFDFSKPAVDCVVKGAAATDHKNVLATTNLADVPRGEFDAVICTEVLEHVFAPWELLQEVESFAKPGGRVILTTPFGAWEPGTYDNKGRWQERAHLWCIDREMFKEMTGDKPNEFFGLLVLTQDADMRPRGNHLFFYDADHAPIKPVAALQKALRHHPRHTCMAGIIAYNNEDSIVKMLNSIEHQAQFVQIAHGPSSDRTAAIIRQWAHGHPWTRVRVIDVPKIEAGKFGFDDARNASAANSQEFEWFLWIDTDEYLSGDFRAYLRDSAMDAYLIAQHHFTCEPRGQAAQIDLPARLLRTNRGFKAYGKVHEHFETPAGGPGRAMQLPDVDIGHVGYVNEATRKGRFFRNYPLLEWDHEAEKPRKLHHFLWLRDIIHRMRFDEENRVKLARDAIQYYNDHREDMGAFGPGLFQSLEYIGEARSVLGEGVPLQVMVKLDDKNTSFQGRFKSTEEAEFVLRQLLEGEFKDRTSRYY